MATLTAETLAYASFQKAMMAAILDAPLTPRPFMDLMKVPKFRRGREVHARRAALLRKRGEYVHFVRWEHGHCIYAWGGPAPETFYFRMGPWQSPNYQPPPITHYSIEKTRDVLDTGSTPARDAKQ